MRAAVERHVRLLEQAEAARDGVRDEVKERTRVFAQGLTDELGLAVEATVRVGAFDTDPFIEVHERGWVHAS